MPNFSPHSRFPTERDEVIAPYQIPKLRMETAAELSFKEQIVMEGSFPHPRMVSEHRHWFSNMC